MMMTWTATRAAIIVTALGLLQAAVVRAQSEPPAQPPDQPPKREAAPQQGTLPEGVTPEAKTAIDRGLAYLARVQERRGSWSNRSGQGAYPVAMTSLAALALLMDGNTTTQGRYAPQVDRATNFLLRSVQPSGLITGGEEESRPMYGHGFAMLFLGQLYGMTEDPIRGKQLHDLLVKAIELTGRGQSQEGGWIYRPDTGGDEGSVTITQVQALRSCLNAGIAVPKNIIDTAMEYLAASQNTDGGIRYSLRQSRGASRAPLTGAAVLCWYLAGEFENPRAKKALDYCKENIRTTGQQGGHDFYAHLYWSQALWVSSDPFWKEYFAARRDYLVRQQKSDGSWEGDRVGDVYDTAVALIILQLPFQQVPIMQQ
jgi:squalene cyclase